MITSRILIFEDRPSPGRELRLNLLDHAVEFDFRDPAKENFEAIKLLVDELKMDPNQGNNEGRTPLMGAAMKGRNDVVQFLVDRGAKLETHDKGNRDTDKVSSAAAGHTWQAVDYAEGLVRVGLGAPDIPAATKVLKDRGVVFIDRGAVQPSDKGALTQVYLGGVMFELVVSHLTP